MDNTVNLDEWYNPTDAAKRLTLNSGKEIQLDYVRTLSRYGKVRTLELSPRIRLYNKADIDSYIVEERGKKSGRAKRIKAHKPKNTETTSQEATNKTD